MRLLAAAGHDLRTPITRMRLRAEFVEDEEERSLWLTDLDELERIADSAILLVREESGKASPETVRLDRLVDDVARELKDQNLDVTVTEAQSVSVRANRLALCPRAAQSHDQCRDPRAARLRQGRGEAKAQGAGAHRGRRAWHSA